MEILCLDVPGACVSRGEHAELAQIHRARRTHWLHGEQLYPEHYFRGAARPARSFHSSPLALSWRASPALRRPARRTTPARFGTGAEEPGRSISVSELPACIDGPSP